MKYLSSITASILLLSTMNLTSTVKAEEGEVTITNLTPSVVEEVVDLITETYSTQSYNEIAFGDLKLRDLGDSYEIIGYTGTGPAISIPAEYEGKVITRIANGAFQNKGLESLNIVNGINYIGDYAFEGNKLVRITIPISVTSIGAYAFANNFIESINTVNQGIFAGEGVYMNNRLVSVEIPESMLEVPKNYYKGNQIVRVNFRGSTQRIGESAFESNYIEELTLPKSVSKIDYRAFRGNKLKSIYISDSVTELGDYVFSENPVKTITAPKRLTSKISQYASATSLDYLNLYETGKDPGYDSKPLTGDTKADYLIQLGISSGLLNLKKPTLSTSNLGNISLQSTNSIVNLKFTDNLEVIDTRGNGEGWHLTLTATPFTQVAKQGGKVPTGGWHQLPKGTISFTGFKEVYTRNSDGTKGGVPTGVTLSKVNSIIDDGAVVVASADKGSGYGVNVFEFNENAIQVNIDPNTVRVDNENYKGVPTPYTSTITWTLVTGPGTGLNK